MSDMGVLIPADEWVLDDDESDYEYAEEELDPQGCDDLSCEECYPQPPVVAVRLPSQDEVMRMRDIPQRANSAYRIQPSTLGAYEINYTASAPVWTYADNPQEELIPDPVANSAPENLEVAYYDHSTPGYAQHLRGAFQFIRRNSANRYSNNSLMRLATAADETRDDRKPVITVATSPMSFDEETEVKSGGTSGMLVTFPDGRALLAVAVSQRRQGIATRLFRHNSNWTTITPHFWVHSTNAPAQQFLLSMGLAPTALNGSGAVRYGYAGIGDE